MQTLTAAATLTVKCVPMDTKQLLELARKPLSQITEEEKRRVLTRIRRDEEKYIEVAAFNSSI